MAEYGSFDASEYGGGSNEGNHNDRRGRDSERSHKKRRWDGDRGKDGDRRGSRRRSRSRSRSNSRERGHRRRDDRDRGSSGRHRHRSREDNDSVESYGSNSWDGNKEYGNAKNQSGNRRWGDNEGQHQYDHDDGNERISGNDWRSKLTSIRDAHFNRSKQAPTIAQNQFKNDGSFMEMFKKKMSEQQGEDQSSLTPNSLVLASSSIPFSPNLSLPPLTATPLLDEKKASSSTVDAELEDLDGVPMTSHKPLPVPVSVGKRRLAKPLKTGIVLKKPQEPEEDEASQEKLDAWARYLQEVQKYKATNCTDEDSSRPLVK